MVYSDENTGGRYLKLQFLWPSHRSVDFDVLEHECIYGNKEMNQFTYHVNQYIPPKVYFLNLETDDIDSHV